MLDSRGVVHAPVDDAVAGADTDSGSLVVQAPPHLRPAPGDRLSLRADPERVFLFDAVSGGPLDRTAAAVDV